jgi:hypothetical protein
VVFTISLRHPATSCSAASRVRARRLLPHKPQFS